MENKKTKLGISAGLLGAAIYFTMLFGGYTPFFILAAYVLLKEENEWLKRVTVKAFALSVCFSIITSAVNLFPDAISIIDRMFSIFNGHVNISFISTLASLIYSLATFTKTVLFLMLGLQAINMSDLSIGFIDKIAEDGSVTIEKAVKSAAPAVKEEVKEAPKAEEKAEEKTEASEEK